MFLLELRRADRGIPDPNQGGSLPILWKPRADEISHFFRNLQKNRLPELLGATCQVTNADNAAKMGKPRNVAMLSAPRLGTVPVFVSAKMGPSPLTPGRPLCQQALNHLHLLA